MNAAIVTGVSRGLGEAMAVALLARGWSVLGIGRASSPRLAGERFRFVPFDLADAERTDDAFAALFGDIADAQPAAVCLVNNAAVAGPAGVFGRLASAEIAASVAVNVAAPAALASLFCRAFAKSDADRRIVNVSSGAAQSTIAGAGIYCASKAGLEMLTRVIAAEQGRDGIVALTLRPGIIDTGMQVYMRSQSDDLLPSAAMFRDFHTSGKLVAPDVAAAKIVDGIVIGPVEQGRSYTYAELAG